MPYLPPLISWYQRTCGHSEEDPAVVKKREEAEAERKLQEARALGTPVTPESFAAWKAAFEEEQRASKVAAGEVVEEEVIATKKTGKQYFLDKYELQAANGLGGDELELEEDDIGEDEEDFDGVEEGEEEEVEDSDDDDDDDDLDMLDAMVAERS